MWREKVQGRASAGGAKTWNMGEKTEILAAPQWRHRGRQRSRFRALEEKLPGGKHHTIQLPGMRGVGL